MAAITATLVDPIVVQGNIRLRILNASAIANTNTYDASKEFTTVLGAWLEPTTAQTHGIALSGAGNTTLTFATGGAVAGRVFIWGY